MATKSVVESPAGESVEVLEDRTWMELTDTDEGSIRQISLTNRKIWVIRALWEHGAFTSTSGRSMKALDDYCIAHYPDYPRQGTGSLTSIMGSTVGLPAFERVTNGKRTHSVKLVALPARWFLKLTKLIADDEASKPPEAPVLPPEAPEADQVASSDQVEADRLEAIRADERLTDQDIQQLLDSVPGVDAPTIFAEGPSLELHMATQVAMSLLTTCVEIITAGSSASIDERVRKLQGDFSEVSQRLSQRLQENDSLRRQLRQAGDEIRALRVERDGLRSRLRATEANLTAALKGDAINAINGEIQRRVDSIMRVGPQSNKGDE